jgi:hypothetical protein
MFFKKKDSDEMSLSPGARTWQRFRRNRSAMAGLLFIIVATLISILGYLITPDHSPYANDQKPELHILPPGSRAQFLLVQRNGEQQETGLLDKMLKGSLDNTLSYSAHSYTFSEGSIQIEEFTGNTPNAGQVSAFNLADVLYPLEPAYVPVYNAEKQNKALIDPLKEEDAYPAMPEDGYGWEKLFSERMCRHFYEDYGLETRVARYHNVYGPNGTWEGGREKAPAALCRKIAMCKDYGVVDVWGPGNQTRSFLYIDECIEGMQRIMASDCEVPLNLGSERMIVY